MILRCYSLFLTSDPSRLWKDTGISLSFKNELLLSLRICLQLCLGKSKCRVVRSTEQYNQSPAGSPITSSPSLLFHPKSPAPSEAGKTLGRFSRSPAVMPVEGATSRTWPHPGVAQGRLLSCSAALPLLLLF